MNAKQKPQNNNTQRSSRKNLSPTTVNNSSNKKRDKKPIIYISISIISLLLFISLRIINDPSRYEWCNTHGWAEGVGNCFILGIEHFTIDASSFAFLGISIAFVIMTIIIIFQKTKR